jgi:hypothetical protein
VIKGGKELLATAAYLGGGFGLGSAGVALLERWAPGFTQGTEAVGASVSALVYIAAFALLTRVVGMRWLGLDRRALRLWPRREAALGFVAGTGLGAVPGLLALGLTVFFARAQWTDAPGTVLGYLGAVGSWAVALFLLSVMWQLAWRGTALAALARGFGPVPASLLVAGAIGATVPELWRPVPVGGVNVVLAELLLCAAFFRFGGFWTAVGAQWGFMTTLMAAGAPNLSLAVTLPAVRYQAMGPGWLDGGVHGPAAGLLATLTIAAAGWVAITVTPERKTG